jgi:hypothetical protein
LPRQHLIGEIIDNEPVAPRERLDEASDLTTPRDPAQGERSQLKARDPALSALLERVHISRGQI